jgi:hypothetical protein
VCFGTQEGLRQVTADSVALQRVLRRKEQAEREAGGRVICLLGS